MSIQIHQSSLDLTASVVRKAPGQATAQGQGASETKPLEPAYRVSLSQTGQLLANANEERSSASGPERKGELNPDEEREVKQLERRDREVRAHEAAHKAAAGSLSSGGVSFGFTTGPDGRRYATSGEVSIDTSKVSGDAEATVRKMQQVRAAALAPASPSSQDRKVAAQATAAAQAARADAARDTEEGSEPSAALASARESSDAVESSSAEKASCSVCGAEDHGSGIHDRANARPIDVFA